MMARGRAILCAGRLYADIVLAGLPRLPVLGREDYAESVLVTAGGGAFITAAHLAGLKRPAHLCAALGSDPISAALVPLIAGAGLSLAFVERFEGGPQLTVALSTGGDRAFATHRDGPAVPALVRQAMAAPDVGHLHIAELATLREAPWLISAARQNRLTVSLDVAWDEAVLDDAEARALAQQVDLLLPNAAEAARLTDGEEADEGGLLAALGARGAAVCIKRGPAGAIYADGRGGIWRAEAPATKVIDTTGAGDAFVAGFLDGWIDGAKPERCLALAIACGTHAVGRLGGAHQVPDRMRVETLARAVRITGDRHRAALAR